MASGEKSGKWYIHFYLFFPLVMTLVTSVHPSRI
jgi:hypothetical protein